MHEKSLGLIREEAVRLLQFEVDLLERMKKAEGVVTQDEAGAQQTFSTDNVDKYVAMLRGEESKLNNMEMVLAVVGTMKAGKSTTINAIVGSEVLPNRNRPMTALPTRIRHKTGQVEPVLYIENNGPLNSLIQNLKAQLKTKHGQQVQQEYAHDQDMSELIRFVADGKSLDQEHRGAQGIFDFLKSLNDLVRLASELGRDFPFSSYAHIEDIPLIEVEFSHLKSMPGNIGKLTLLDTPGPNEAGQAHLREMLREQLQNASAVMAILDYTQLKSDADEQVRDELERIADVAQGRMFALVNKFDQKNSNSDDAEQTKRVVAESLLKGRVEADKVFPISSMFGYLANCARRELALHGRLPDAKNEPWVEDFGNTALGPLWKDFYDDMGMVQKAADKLWEKSLFENPLDNVIHKAYEQAAMLAVSSAASKLADVGSKINNFLGARESSIRKSEDELLQQIRSLERDIESIQNLEKQAGSDADEALQAIGLEIASVIEEVRFQVGKEIDNGFNEAKEVEKKDLKRKADEEERRLQKERPLWFLLFDSQQPKKKTSGFGFDFDPKDPVIKLDSKQEASKIVKGIDSSVAEVFDSQEKLLVKAVNAIADHFQKQFDENISSQANKVVGELNKRLNNEGFEIALKAPQMVPVSMRDGASLLLRDAIEDKRRKVTSRRHKSGAWGKVCGWLGTKKLGTEEYERTVGNIEIDIRKVRAGISETIDEIFKGLETSMVEKVEKPLKQRVDEFFDEFKGTVDQLRGDLVQGIREKQGSQERQRLLAKRLAEFKSHAPGIKQDSEALKLQADELTGATHG